MPRIYSVNHSSFDNEIFARAETPLEAATMVLRHQGIDPYLHGKVIEVYGPYSEGPGVLTSGTLADYCEFKVNPDGTLAPA